MADSATCLLSSIPAAALGPGVVTWFVAKATNGYVRGTTVLVSVRTNWPWLLAGLLCAFALQGVSVWLCGCTETEALYRTYSCSGLRWAVGMNLFGFASLHLLPPLAMVACLMTALSRLVTGDVEGKPGDAMAKGQAGRAAKAAGFFLLFTMLALGSVAYLSFAIQRY